MAAKTPVLLVGRSIARMVEIAAKLDPRDYAHVVAQSHSPLEYLMGTFRTRPAVAIVDLPRYGSVVEFQDVLEQSPSTSFVFLVAEMPPAAAIAKVTAGRAVFLDGDESALTIAATAMSVLHQRHEDARQA